MKIELGRERESKLIIESKEKDSIQYVDVRIWYWTGGEWAPSRKGFFLTAPEFDELRKKLNEVSLPEYSI